MRRIMLTLMALSLTTVVAAAEEPKEEPLSEQLEAMSEKFKKAAPPEMVKIFQDGIKQVAETGIVKDAKQVGDEAPNFSLPNSTGETVTLTELTDKGPVVLTWYRGGWCPYCNLHLRAMAKKMPEFKAAGATLVAISPQKPDQSLDTKQREELPFEVLSDTGNEVARDYGVVFELPPKVKAIYQQRIDLKKFNGDDSYELPLAATYVIGRDGKIRYAFLDADYTKRAEPSEVVEAVKKAK